MGSSTSSLAVFVELIKFVPHELASSALILHQDCKWGRLGVTPVPFSFHEKFKSPTMFPSSENTAETLDLVNKPRLMFLSFISTENQKARVERGCIICSVHGTGSVTTAVYCSFQWPVRFPASFAAGKRRK